MDRRSLRVHFEAELWEYQGVAPWVFVTIPIEVAGEIRDSSPSRRPFGSVKVAVELGGSRWQTSLFPDPESGSFVLPVKKEIRRIETLEIGDSATFAIELVE